jgi:hypothetical protein
VSDGKREVGCPLMILGGMAVGSHWGIIETYLKQAQAVSSPSDVPTGSLGQAEFYQDMPDLAKSVWVIFNVRPRAHLRQIR